MSSTSEGSDRSGEPPDVTDVSYTHFTEPFVYTSLELPYDAARLGQLDAEDQAEADAEERWLARRKVGIAALVGYIFGLATTIGLLMLTTPS